ncbi:MAG: NAD-dependent epimerase/dehydratase family protein [Anaerolineales bacterium]|jgi:UDP-glucose 4-epimerase
MPQVLVTGASGYIGSHLVRSLAADGYAVRGFSRRSSPDGFLGAEWHTGDVRQIGDVYRAVQGCKVALHLVASPLRRRGADLKHDFQVNAVGTLNVLSAALALGVGRTIYASTAQLYGRSGRLPMAESDQPLPHTSYASSKLCGELLCMAIARSHGMDVAALRLFNVYGPQLDGSPRPTVEAVFVRRALQGLPLLITAPAKEARDFIHMDDVVRALRMAMDKGAAGQVINIGTGISTSLSDLAEMVIELSGSKAPVRIEGTKQEPMRMQADVRKARKVLGFKSQVGLRDGLSQLIEFQRRRGKDSA